MRNTIGVLVILFISGIILLPAYYAL